MTKNYYNIRYKAHKNWKRSYHKAARRANKVVL